MTSDMTSDMKSDMISDMTSNMIPDKSSDITSDIVIQDAFTTTKMCLHSNMYGGENKEEKLSALK